MYKIAILGCENSHADSFLRLMAEGKYPDMEAVGIYSCEPEAAKKLSAKFGVPIMENYDSLRGQVDGVMITARHGDNHFKYAKAYLDDGIPMFIDKPITCSEGEAVEFMTVAKEKGIRLCGGSTCVATEQTVALANTVREQALGRVFGGSLACPVYMDSPYGGIWFYAQHLVEVMTTVFGTNVQAVQAKRTGDTLTFLARYPEFTVSGTFAEALRYYHVTVYGAQGVQQETLQLTPDSFRHEMDAMLHLLRGGEMEKGYAEFVVPVYIISAILRAVESGCWETVGQADV